MFIDDFIWLPAIADKIQIKHNLTPEEVEEIFFNQPKFRKVEEGLRNGEDVFAATGQTDTGKYLVVFFIRKANNVALIISARTMDKRERRRYGKK
ncbi:MAG: BrnT family toxin [Chloroflexi bacterium]|nr:BrnT family toxin [Chloroflexota bacterium]